MNSRHQSIRLQMPDPCTKDFEQMPDVGNGRFCASCNKTVHDVAHLPDAVLSLFLNTSTKVCVRLHADQLDRDIFIDHKVDASTPLPGVSVHLLKELMPGSVLGIHAEDPVIAGNRWLTGFLKNETSPLPLSHAIITIDTLGIGLTDELGWFKFFVPDDIEYSDLAFKVSIKSREGSYCNVLTTSVKVRAYEVTMNAYPHLK
ncbi:MAG: hypothetical protein BGO31_19290 [Bacteroidetes bacterium 43-16]|nr:MAG: hypothetical protein BGO31_19290 [Bacteroidetes bacterium 43-16]